MRTFKACAQTCTHAQTCTPGYTLRAPCLCPPSSKGDAQGPAPVFLALVDTSRGCDADFIELVRSGLLASLEALPPYTLFGLITFGDKVRAVLSPCSRSSLFVLITFGALHPVRAHHLWRQGAGAAQLCFQGMQGRHGCWAAGVGCWALEVPRLLPCCSADTPM